MVNGNDIKVHHQTDWVKQNPAKNSDYGIHILFNKLVSTKIIHILASLKLKSLIETSRVSFIERSRETSQTS